ncbi:GT23 domain-containing protein [Meloidogyne graminicola]|uniref:GT23 domain-containing protein n=1 Tax=Meloidogyne graminicola TaxID=189291 RepID=A0A8S9ZJZ9_9BILA|nr:GT23 domain-containing protein [Meloidogyne graminicola]
MTLIQRLIYLQRLYEYNSVQNIEQKQKIDKQIISHLLEEGYYHKKQNNYQHLSVMSEKIQSVIDLLQHPYDCSKARFIVCPLHTQCCGLGCIIHQICYCLALASGSGRTVIIDSEETKIYKFDVKWNELFKPITNCSYTKHVKSFLPLKNYENSEQTDRILYFEYRPELGFRVIYELMQAIQGDAYENAHSIDYLYGQYWNENEMDAISDYKPIPEYPATPEELWAEKGDVIVVKSPIHQDGFIRGRNQRLNTEGNFPMYLLKDHIKFINLSAFANI